MKVESVLKKFKILDPIKINHIDTKLIYDCYNISIHQKFLNDIEADNYVVFYSNELKGKELENYIKLENKFLDALEKTHNLFEIIELKINNKYQNNQFTTDSVNFVNLNGTDIRSIALKGLREIEDFIFVIPELGLILRSDFDLELILFSIKDNLSNIELFYSFFKENGLFLLKT